MSRKKMKIERFAVSRKKMKIEGVGEGTVRMRVVGLDFRWDRIHGW